MDPKKEIIISENTIAMLKELSDYAMVERQEQKAQQAQQFHKMINEQYMDKVIVELGELQEALQENSHLAPRSWGKSIILVAADIIREYGKERPK